MATSMKDEKADEVERQLELYAKFVLMKFADGMVQDSYSLEGLRLKYFVPTMKDLVDGNLHPAFSDPTAFGTEEIESMASLLILHLEILKTILQPDNNPNVSSKASSSLTQVLIGTPPFLSTLL